MKKLTKKIEEIRGTDFYNCGGNATRDYILTELEQAGIYETRPYIEEDGCDRAIALLEHNLHALDADIANYLAAYGEAAEKTTDVKRFRRNRLDVERALKILRDTQYCPAPIIKVPAMRAAIRDVLVKHGPHWKLHDTLIDDLLKAVSPMWDEAEQENRLRAIAAEFGYQIIQFKKL